MADQIRFTQGVSQNDEAPLEAPYDLENAHIKRPHAVEALNGMSSADSSIVSIEPNNEIFEHANSWVSATSAAHYRSTLYSTEKGSRILKVHPRDSKTAEGSIPKINSVNVSYSGGSVVRDLQNNVIIYALVPINQRGEAGIWRYAAAVPSNDLPFLDIKVSSTTKYVEVYRTAELDGDIEDSSPQTYSFHYLGRYSSDPTPDVNYYTSVPHANESESVRKDYLNKTGISYIYLSDKKDRYITENNSGSGIVLSDDQEAAVFDNTKMKEWKVVFKNLHSSNNLSTGTEYYISDKLSGGRLLLEDSNGNPLNFDGSDIVKEVDSTGLNEFRGVLIQLKPPTGSERAGSNILVNDNRGWSFKPNEEGERIKSPDTRPLERDRTLHGRTVASFTATSSHGADTDQFTISGEKDSFFTDGDIVTFRVTVNKYQPNIFGDIEVTGSASVTVEAGTDTPLVRLLGVRRASGNENYAIASYRISDGQPDFTVELLVGTAESYDDADSSTSSTVVVTQTVGSTGEGTITHKRAGTDSRRLYKVRVTDSTGGTSETVWNAINPVE